MTFAAADPVPSGKPFPVLHVAGRRPGDLGDFVGDDVHLTIDCSGTQTLVAGCGAALTGAVRFHEKDASSGKDVRLWRIIESAAGKFVAEQVASGQR